ncbi:MAG: CcmD family protein [Anaerolineae bacterium]|nr:CcmD family protein [Anaerolineae bacterium]MDW8102926.1 CcmD family protein [Anaerolineae bacterium]
MGYLFAAYAVVWLILFILVLSIERRQAQLEKELKAFKETRRKEE